MKHIILALLLGLTLTQISAQGTWTNFNTVNDGLANIQISSLVVDHDNNLWGAYAGAGGQGPGAFKYDGTTWTTYTTANSGFLNNDVRAITVDAGGNIWFAFYNAGIVKYDGQNWTPYTTANSGLVGNGVNSITIDQDNNLWIGAYFDGVSRFNGTTWTNYTHDTGSPFADSNCINGVLMDRAGNLWVAMDCGGGLAKRSPSGVWTNYKASNSNIPYHTPSSIGLDADGNVWVGFIGGSKLWKYNGTVWQTYDFAGGAVTWDGFFLDPTGKLWAASAEDGPYAFDGTSWKPVRVAGSPNKVSGVRQSLASDAQGRIWWSEQFQGLWRNDAPQCSELVAAFEPVVDELNLTLTSDYRNAESWTWTIDEDYTSDKETVNYTLAKHTPVNVCLTVRNFCGASDTHCVEVSPVCPELVAAFEPVVDGQNITLTSDYQHAESWTWKIDEVYTSDGRNITYVLPEGVQSNICLTVHNICDESDTRCVEVGAIVAGTTARTENGLKIAPNPFKQSIILQSTTSKQANSVDIFTLQGQCVYTSPWSAGRDMTIDLPNAGTGVYFVQVTYDDRIVTQRLIKID